MITTENCIYLKDFLKRLPETKPRVAFQTISNWFKSSYEGDWRKESIMSTPVKLTDGTILTALQLSEIYQDFLGPSVVSPYGAKVLIKLYRLGHLPGKGKIGEVPADLEKYSTNPENLQQVYENTRNKNNSWQQFCSKDLSLYDEHDFSYQLLEELFRRHYHNKKDNYNALNIGGLKVRKELKFEGEDNDKYFNFKFLYAWANKNGVLVTLDVNDIEKEGCQ
jgi:hypothetical protein